MSLSKLRVPLCLAVSLVSTLAAGAARADEAPAPNQVTAPAEPASKPTSITAFATTFGDDEFVQTYGGIELAVRASPHVELTIDYTRLGGGGDGSFALVGAGVRLRTAGQASQFVYASAAGLVYDGDIFLEGGPLVRAGVGADWTGPSGAFLQGQLGVAMIMDEDAALEGRVGVGFRF